MRDLLSKLIAGGLSAGVILLWWPQFFPGDSLQSWLVRGVAWTLCFELLAVALGSFERELWETRRAQNVRSRVSSARTRLAPVSPQRRLGLRAAVACTALLIPVVLMATGLQGRHLEAKPATEVEKVTKVTRIVKVERREVKVPVEVERAASIVPAETVRRAPAKAPQRKRPTERLSERTSDRRTSGDKPETGTSPTPQTTQPAPAPQPAPQQQAPAQTQPDAGASAAAGAKL